MPVHKATSNKDFRYFAPCDTSVGFRPFRASRRAAALRGIRSHICQFSGAYSAQKDALSAVSKNGVNPALVVDRERKCSGTRRYPSGC
jgi:hypothetical protein